MIRSSAILAVLIAGLMFTSNAQAGLNVAFDFPVNVGDGLYQHTPRLVADGDADIVTAWDGAFSGPMNQVWYAGATPTPTLDIANDLTADQAGRDSHFSFAGADIVTARAFSESATSLDGAFAITTSAQMRNLPLAQIVVPSETIHPWGDPVHFGGLATTRDGVAYYISGAMMSNGRGVGYTCITSPAGYTVGQPIHFSGTWGPADPEDPSALMYVVYKIEEDPEFPGSYSYGTIQKSLDPNFTFTPTEVGKYMLAFGRAGIGIGGAMPSPMEFNVTPEPATLSLLLVGLAGLARRRR